MAHRIGIIGGSGLYDIEGLENQSWSKVDTPFGSPSDELLSGTLAGREVVFLPRHGRGHRLLPSELNHRANIWAMKQLGVKWIISVSAVGSLQELYALATLFSLISLSTKPNSTASTTSGEGIVALCLRRSICPGLSSVVAAQSTMWLIMIEGPTSTWRPAFSTRAESVINHQAGLV